MCTLSIYASAKHTFITMNRDELRTRHESGVFNAQNDERHNGLVFPVDDSSQGTWIGVNKKGVVLCLLNHYQGQQQQDLESRGNIIPSALLQGEAVEVESFLTSLDQRRYNPFDLFLISQQHRVHFQWNGEVFKYTQLGIIPWYMFTSSSYQTDEVIAHRQSWFKNWTKETESNPLEPKEIISGFHFNKTQSPATHSVLMSRKHSHTKSIVQIQLERENINMDYYLVANDSSFLAEARSQKMSISDGMISN